MKPVAVPKKLRGGSLRKRPLKISDGSIEKAKQGHAKYVYRIVKQEFANADKCLWAVDFLNGELAGSDGFDHIASEAARLSHYNTRRAISSHEIQSALKLLYPERLKSLSKDWLLPASPTTLLHFMACN